MSVTLTGTSLIQQATYTLQLVSPTQPVAALEQSVAVYLLQELIDRWNLEDLTVLTVSRHVYSLTSGQGSPENPYTLGPGSAIPAPTFATTSNSARPTHLEHASLLLTTQTPSVEVPLSCYTQDSWNASQIKDLTTPTQPTSLFYSPTNPLGTVILWPVPLSSTNQLCLYYGDFLPAFTANLGAPYVCPPGYAQALRLNLALLMCPYFFINADRVAVLQTMAIDALDTVKAANLKMADLSMDPAYLTGVKPGYNILTDQGSN